MTYFSSLSLRRASHILEPIIKRSHVAIWKWIQRYSSVLDSFDVSRKNVRAIFIDETEINVGGKKAWVWVAFEPEHFFRFTLAGTRTPLTHTIL